MAAVCTQASERQRELLWGEPEAGMGVGQGNGPSAHARARTEGKVLLWAANRAGGAANLD